MSRWWQEVSMQLANLLRESLDVDCDEVWENERTPTPVRVFGVRLHSMGLSVREVVAVLDLLGVDRSHGAVWNWTHDLACVCRRHDALVCDFVSQCPIVFVADTDNEWCRGVVNLSTKWRLVEYAEIFF